MANRAGPNDWLSADPVDDDGKVAYQLNVKVVGGAGSGNASAANQALQLTQETLTNTRIGDTASPAAGTIISRLGLLAAVSGLRGGNPTYRVAVGGPITPYATPTDLFSLNGSATKTVIVISMWFQVVATAISIVKVAGIKRSAVNTGTTTTATAGVSLDSTNAAATAVFALHTAAPSVLGTAAGNLSFVDYSVGAATGGGTFAGVYANGVQQAYLPTTMAQDMRQPIILRGVAESINLNMNSAAWPAGAEIRAYGAEWIEV